MSEDMMRLMGEADAAAEASLVAADEALATFQAWCDRWARRQSPNLFHESVASRRLTIGSFLREDVRWMTQRASGIDEVRDAAGHVLVLLARYCSEHNVSLAHVAAGVRAKLTARLRAHEEGR